MVFNVTYNNISDISRQTILLVQHRYLYLRSMSFFQMLKSMSFFKLINQRPILKFMAVSSSIPQIDIH
jgi:hypothetical protein